MAHLFNESHGSLIAHFRARTQPAAEPEYLSNTCLHMTNQPQAATVILLNLNSKRWILVAYMGCMYVLLLAVAHDAGKGSSFLGKPPDPDVATDPPT